ncbi:G-protein coupled receptor GRL101-like [Stylophora pistillata]|uniref:G-protein coupled receptor GRL101-like n=1 Tax=Stylophora pistillata TaxID=50429 RepID=UPI000C049EBD|nr:G-protein coupled receptor GRL101-like [Stylophora pistillata]
MFRGPGKKTLTIYQKTKTYRKIPIWISGSNTGKNWLYGQVPLNCLSEFQVLIEGKTETREDLIALAGLYIEEGNLCQHKPWSAKQACNETLTNKSGYFFSPLYPGHSLDDILCRWLITVPQRHIIHLKFQEFRLREHPTCDKCFVEVFDGSEKTGPSLGKFCGYLFPPDFLSSSNHLTVFLSCHGNLPVARLKALYHSVSAKDNDEPSCSRRQSCPSSCKCEDFGEGKDNGTIVTGVDLLSVPSNLPPNTRAVFFQKNRIPQLQEKAFANLDKLEYIDMSFNILLRLRENCFQNVPSVETMRLNFNFLQSLPDGVFLELPNLRVLDLGKNRLRKVVKGMLDGLFSIEVLGLRSNQIERVEYGVFENKSTMTHLYLQDNKLKTLPEGLFEDLSKLKVLDLSGNELTVVTKGTFKGLKSLEYLYLNNNKLSDVPSDAFSELENLKYLKLDRFIFCCYAIKSIEGVDCDSPINEFSSCDDLMKNEAVQVCIWILGILALLGNVLVIIWRAADKEESRVQSCLLTNLAVADLFMGVYLLTIAIMDSRWRGEYFKHDIKWRSSIGCQIIGALSMLSSEVSVLILTIITIDRLICIVFPFKFKRLTYKAAVLSCMGVWMFGIVISVIPITGVNYFYDESGDFGFYSRSAVCLPLQLSEGTPAGWEYSFSFFVGLNFISFTFILVAYISIFWTVKRAARAARSTNFKKESEMAKRLAFIVMTDFCCWMPIITISVLSLTGNFEDPNKIAYVWIAVFVLPINSSINPILYTFSTQRAKQSLTKKGKHITGIVMKTLNERMPGE